MGEVGLGGLRFVGLGFGAAWQAWFGSVRLCLSSRGTAWRILAGAAGRGWIRCVMVRLGGRWQARHGGSGFVSSRCGTAW